jgi:hypothetical protein
MPAHDPVVRALSSKIAAIERHHPNADTGELRRDMHAAQLAEQIQRVVDEAPPLSAEQRARLAVLLLRPTGNGGRAA